jgi:hypothetical protein
MAGIQNHTESAVSDATAFIARHPKIVLFLVLLVLSLAFQGTVSAEGFGGGDFATPTASNGTSDGP